MEAWLFAKNWFLLATTFAVFCFKLFTLLEKSIFLDEQFASCVIKEGKWC
jgi:hypothetical protein